MQSNLLLAEITREEARTASRASLVVFPVGATEQHGPHLPVGTDFFAVEAIARRAAAEAAKQIPVLVAPTMPFGSSHHHLPFGGTMSLRTQTYYQALYDLTESLITSGFRRVFLLNGHGGNSELIELVVRDLAQKHPVGLAAASYWTVAWEALIGAEAYRQGALPGHAGVFETSVIMALRPELVREPRPHREQTSRSEAPPMRLPYRVEQHGFWESIDGFTDSPARADPNSGDAWLNSAIRTVAEAMVSFHLEAGGKRYTSPEEGPR